MRLNFWKGLPEFLDEWLSGHGLQHFPTNIISTNWHHEGVLISVLTPECCDIWSMYRSTALIIFKSSAKFTTRHKQPTIVVNSVWIQSRVNTCDLVYVYGTIVVLIFKLWPSEEKLFRRHQIDFENRIWYLYWKSKTEFP